MKKLRKNMRSVFHCSKILGIIPGHSALERFHVAAQSGMRLRLYESATKIPGLTAAERKSAADFIAAITGRSNLLPNPGVPAQLLLTAPKMYVGQAEAMTAWLRPKFSPLNILKQNRAVKRMVAKRTAARIAVLVGAKAVAEEYGWEMSLNPDDSDFLKLRKGDTVIEAAGGYTPYYRAIFSTLNNLASSSRKNSTPLDDTAMGELRKKFSPAVSAAFSVAEGKNFVGEPMFADKEGNRTLLDTKSWLETFGTITANDVYDMVEGSKFKSMDNAGKVGVGTAAFFGVGAQSYDKRKPRQKGFEDTRLGQILQNFGVASTPSTQSPR
jgi:hypothetical protein